MASFTLAARTSSSARVLIACAGFEYAWWIEMDMGTESRATLRRKLNRYILAAQAGAVGPDQFLPQVLVCVPDDKRLSRVEEIIASLSPSAAKLFMS